MFLTFIFALFSLTTRTFGAAAATAATNATAINTFNIDPSIIPTLKEYGPVASLVYSVSHPMLKGSLNTKIWFQVNISKNNPSKALATVVRLDNVQERMGEAMNYVYQRTESDLIWRSIQGWTDGVLIEFTNGDRGSIKHTIKLPPNHSVDAMQFELDNSFYNFKPIPKPSENREIPPIIHQITSNIKGEKMKVIEKSIILVQLKNQNYDHREYSLDEMPSFIEKLEGIWARKAFEKLIPGAYKADLLRLILLKHYGGNYLDSKLIPLKAFDEILPQRGPHLCKAIGLRDLQNALMSFGPGDPLPDMAIQRIIKNVQNNYYGVGPYSITGPRLVQEVINNSGLKYPFQMKMVDIYRVLDEKMETVHIFHNAEYRRMQTLVPDVYYSTLWRERAVYKE